MSPKKPRSKKPKKPLEKQRRCSECGRFGHSKAAHHKKPPALPRRKRLRRNLDAP